MRKLLATSGVVSLMSFGHVLGGLPPVFGLPEANAQDVQVSSIFDEDTSPSPEEQLLLESDELTYDNDRGLVIATGNVQIAYGRSTLVADKVEYNQQSGRVIAVGNVEILEPNGNRIFAREIDITDDFRDGFVSALNIQTPDKTRIAAESAERRDGQITAFNNGVYTACQKCEKNPEKPPFWQIRAKKVVVNNETKQVEYEDAQFEFFGRPVAALKRFSHADPAVKRKSGFLFPGVGDDENLGFHYRQGYFFNLAPDYDLTVWGTYYSEQGFLGEAEWRQRLENGEYSIRYAGIDQDSPEVFGNPNIFVDSSVDDRHAVMTNGLFDINNRWQFGWSALFQSDENFARTYELEGFTTNDIVNEVYLKGIGEKNYFDLRGQDFLVQSSLLDSLRGTSFPGNQTATEQQATILPVLDYNAVSDGTDPGLGQLSFDLNITNVNRDATQVSNFVDNGMVDANERFSGLDGDTLRTSALLEWKGSDISDQGLISTLELGVQGDAISQDTRNLNSSSNPLLSNDSIYRAMPSAMLEIRYPLIAQSYMATQLFEPIAQIITRPDEEYIGEFANEDAQSLVFNASNLFESDKFSGYDRVEGGTRANVGFRYSASFASGSNINIVAGQSFHIAGMNSFAATNDLVNVGEESGLETDRSDYVAAAQFDNGNGFSAGVGVRLDESDLGLERVDVSSRITQPDYTLTGTYIFADAQPNYRFNRDRHEIMGSGSFSLNENWRVSGSVTYDLVTETNVKESVGLAYYNDCFSFSLSYSNNNNSFTGESTGQSINFSLGLRTIGNFQQSVDIGDES
ncbi:MAG: LPS-assembly protein LptD [Pseudomonadota bacterium]